MISTQYIKLNMTPNGIPPVLYCSQYDVGRPLGVVIYNGSESVDLSGYTVTIEGTRTDRTPVTAGMTTDGNIGVFTTTPTMTNENDTYRAKVVLTDNAGRVSSLAFVMCVDEKTMDENAEEIEEDASLYQQYTGTVQTIIAQIRGDLAAEITARQNAISAEASARQAADNTLQSNINAEASTRATQDASLQSQINQLIAPSGSAPSAAEVENARIGSDGTVYPTLGDAIRTQNSLLKSHLDEIYDDGQLLTITSQAMLHPTGDGTFTISGDTITYHEVTNQQNVIGFTFASEIGKQYTVSCRLKFQTGNMALYAVKGTTVSTTVYEGHIDPISASGSYSFTFTASTGTTTIWAICQAAVDSAVISNLLCSAGWGYKHLDTEFTEEKFPAQGKAVGALADRVTAVEDSVDRIIQNNNLVVIDATTLRHTSGNATAVFDLPNGFTTNNSGNTNNLFGFNIPTQAKRTYRLKLNVVAGPILSLYICKTETYNGSNYIDKRENLVAGDSIDIQFDATTDITSVWFNQRYSVASIAVSNVFAGDDIIRYNRYILDYSGTEITVFNKILCIGDSITEGTFNYESSGSIENVIVESQYSYPTYLQKLSGCEVVNLGHGGYTAGQWYERYQNTDLSGYDACIIMLGINDSFQGVSIASFKASMTNIINKVISDNQGIKVFVATIVPAYSDYNPRFDNYIAEIKRLVEEDFPDAFLIDINKYSECKYYTYYAQGHLTAIGYQELAKEFYTLISYTIHNDLQAFRNIQFIGTNYTYPDFADT